MLFEQKGRRVKIMSENKNVIVYASSHHGNTKKIIDAIAGQYPVDLVDVTQDKYADLEGYECIGIASGIAFGKYYPQLLEFLKERMPGGKKVFFIHTAGAPKESHNAAAKAITDSLDCSCLGTFFCKGFDTYGPWKLIGGINKKHPDQKDMEKAIDFYKGIGQ